MELQSDGSLAWSVPKTSSPVAQEKPDFQVPELPFRSLE
jgi:hypothetical protein